MLNNIEKSSHPEKVVMVTPDAADELKIKAYEARFEIMNREILCALEVDVTDPCVRKTIHQAFSECFKDVQIINHQSHECPPNIFCLKFKSTIGQSNDLASLIIVLCSNYHTELYEMTGDWIGYQETDGRGDYYYLFEYRNNIEKLRHFEIKNLKKTLTAMDVYYPVFQ